MPKKKLPKTYYAPEVTPKNLGTMIAFFGGTTGSIGKSFHLDIPEFIRVIARLKANPESDCAALDEAIVDMLKRHPKYKRAYKHALKDERQTLLDCLMQYVTD